MSLAVLAKGWKSGETMSTTASIAELNNSAISTIVFASKRTHLKTEVRGKKIITGNKMRKNANSCRKAASFTKAARRPDKE